MTEPTETVSQLMLLSSTAILSTYYHGQNLKTVPAELFSSSENTPSRPTNTQCAKCTKNVLVKILYYLPKDDPITEKGKT